MLLTSATSGRAIARQVGDVAGLAGAHFVDRELRVFRRIEHGQRQADLVVAIAGLT